MLDDPFFMHHFAEMMSKCGFIFIKTQEWLSKLVKSLRMFLEIINFKYCLWIWNIVLLKIVIQSCPFASEIRNTSTYTDASPSHDDNVFEFVLLQAFQEIFFCEFDGFLFFFLLQFLFLYYYLLLLVNIISLYNLFIVVLFY